MERGTTFFLKGVITVIGLVALAFCVLTIPVALRSENISDYGPVFFGTYAAAVPFFIALYQVVKLLGNVDRNEAFSGSSVKALNYIKRCALAVAGIYVLGMPYLYVLAEADDAPGILAVALVIAFASAVAATAVAVLQKLIQNALDLKAENDLTV